MKIFFKQRRQTHSKGEGVILLGTDTPIGLAVIRDLGRHGYTTIGIGRRKNALARYSAHCHHHVVRMTDEAALVEQIIRLANDHGASYLLAISESDLLMLNRHRDRLERAVKVLTPSTDDLAKVLDKCICQEHAEAVGIRAPRTMRFSSLAEARDKSAALSFPVVLKWPDPNIVFAPLAAASLSFFKTEYAATASELLASLGRYEKIKMFPMVQEYCPGAGMGQMFLVKDGETVMEFQHHRLHEWPPEGGASSLCKSVPLTEHGEIRERSRALLKRLRWNGVAMVEYRYDQSNGAYYFLEINGRFWGSLPLAIACGMPFAAGLVSECGQNGASISFPVRYPDITACYLIPETKRLVRLLFQPKAIKDPFFRPDTVKSLLVYLTMPFRCSTRYYVFQFSDPKPFLADMLSVMAKILKLNRHEGK